MERGVYWFEADASRKIYLKEESILSEVGHFHDSLEFIFMTEGEICAHSFTDSVTVRAGEIFFSDSFECHYYRKLTETIGAIVLVVSSEYVSLFRNLYKNKTLPMHMNQCEKNKKILSLVREWNGEANKTFMLNVGYCNLLLAYILESYPLVDRSDGNNKSVAVQLLKYVGENFTKPITLESAAEQIGYTKQYCSKIFFECVGMHFREYLNHLRLKKADELFSVQKDTKQTATEIIYESGFSSTVTYYRALKSEKEKNINF